MENVPYPEYNEEYMRGNKRPDVILNARTYSNDSMSTPMTAIYEAWVAEGEEKTGDFGVFEAGLSAAKILTNTYIIHHSRVWKTCHTQNPMNNTCAGKTSGC